MEEINIKIDDNNDSKNAEKNIWVYATIIIIAILIPVLIIFCGTDNSNSNSSNAGLTYTNYCKVENGMTYSEVVELFGKQGVLDTQSSVAGYTLSYYIWEKDSYFDYICVVIGFENGKVCSKTQVGLS